MTIRIEDNKLVGSITTSPSFLNGSPDCRQYEMIIDYTGADINEVCKRAQDSGTIILRKRIKTKDQAVKLGTGITFGEMVSAAPKDANSALATVLNKVEDISKESALEAIKALQARIDAAAE